MDQAAIASEQQVQDPTTLIRNYLTQQGVPINSENVRRALEANAANPGLIGGLVSQEPPPMDVMGNNKGMPNRTSAMPVPPIPPQQAVQATQAPVSNDVTNSTGTSILEAPPSSFGMSLADAIQLGIGLASTGALAAVGVGANPKTPGGITIDQQALLSGANPTQPQIEGPQTSKTTVLGEARGPIVPADESVITAPDSNAMRQWDAENAAVQRELKANPKPPAATAAVRAGVRQAVKRMAR